MVQKFEVGKKYVFSNAAFPTIYTCTAITPLGYNVLQWDIVVGNNKTTHESIVRDPQHYKEYIEVKKGWVNVFVNQTSPPTPVRLASLGGWIYADKKTADEISVGTNRIACIEVTWKDGDGL